MLALAEAPKTKIKDLLAQTYLITSTVIGVAPGRQLASRQTVASYSLYEL